MKELLTKNCVYKGHFGGPLTPKSLSVDLTVQPTDRPYPYENRPLMIGSMRVATYNGKVTKASVCAVHDALREAQATEAWTWTAASGWCLIASLGCQ